MAISDKPGLFGQKHSSRDYSDPEVWGKNQFNSSFPASLVAYMFSKLIEPVYLHTDAQGSLCHSLISAQDIFGIDPLSDEAYYDFEAGFAPYEIFYNGPREKVDLVMLRKNGNQVTSLRGLEIKLTAVPDESTRHSNPEDYSAEIVVRPPTICFMACSMCKEYTTPVKLQKLKQMLSGVPQINHWEEISEVADHYNQIQEAVLKVIVDLSECQIPLMIQPIWRCEPNSVRLAKECLDVFVWSNTGLIHMFTTSNYNPSKGINRYQRSMIWLYKMLFDYSVYGHFDYNRIIKLHSYNTANDKAFSISGKKSLPLLRCDELLHPRVSKEEIKNIILGGGQNYLRPERRFDAVIVNSPDLFA